MESQIINIHYVVSALVFSAIGLAVLAVSFKVFDLMTPGDLWKEIVENKNVGLAITAGAMILAMAQIIAAAIHG
jgi:putative membrane protein